MKFLVRINKDFDANFFKHRTSCSLLIDAFAK